MKCPKCGSTRTAPIQYGFPVRDEEELRKLRDQELYKGAFLRTDTSPGYHCFACGEDCGYWPILRSERGKEFYKRITTAISFRTGSFFGGWVAAAFVKDGSGFRVRVSPNLSQPEAGLERVMTGEEWNKLMDRLYGPVRLHEWGEEYDAPGVQDGEQWRLQVTLTGDRVRTSVGSSVCPPYWAELMRAFKPYFREAGISTPGGRIIRFEDRRAVREPLSRGRTDRDHE